MRRLLALASLLLAPACEPPQSFVFTRERLPVGASLTVHVLGPDPAGLEHALSRSLKEAGFDVRSSAAVSLVVSRKEGEGEALSQETLRRYATRYVCRVKTGGQATYVHFYNIQLIDLETGRLLVSLQSGRGQTYRAAEVAEHLRETLR